MKRKVHRFDNGVMVYDDHLIPVQRERYKKKNVHEAEEEDIFVAIIKDLPRGGCFVNIGSAIGYYPLLAKKINPALSVHALEPLKVHRKRFKENIKLNGFSDQDFILHKEGIYSTDGYTSFLEQGFGSKVQVNNSQVKQPGFSPKTFFSALRSRFNLINIFKSQPVTIIKTMKLDNFVRSVDRPIDLLQMDVQGMEKEVLSGGTESLERGLIKTFLIGTHDRYIHRKCLDLLDEYNYLVEYELFDTKEQPDGIVVASKGVRRLKYH